MDRLFVLFRGAEVQCPDEFVDTLRKNNLNAVTVAPLNFEFVNIPQFVQHLQQFHSLYSALVITSPRVLDLIRKVSTNESTGPVLSSPISSLLATIPVLPVGPKSTCIAFELGFRPLIPIPIDRVNNASQLAQVIIDAVQQSPELAERLQKRPIWMPTSDIGREQLVHLLRPVNIRVNKFVCYRTVAYDRLDSDLRQVLLQTNFFKETSTQVEKESAGTACVECRTTGGMNVYFVMFSPSGVDSVRHQVSCLSLDNVNWLAIGPTTEQHMKQVGLRVSTTAERPTPEGLLTSIARL